MQKRGGKSGYLVAALSGASRRHQYNGRRGRRAQHHERSAPVSDQQQPDKPLRDLGIAIGDYPTGPSNSLTDVPGIRVGHATLLRGDDVRTGVTAIWPHDGNPMSERVYAGIHVLNGYGEMTSRSVIDEWGLLATPVVLTG